MDRCCRTQRYHQRRQGRQLVVEPAGLLLTAALHCHLQTTEAGAETDMVQEDVVGQCLIVMNTRVGKFLLFFEKSNYI